MEKKNKSQKIHIEKYVNSKGDLWVRIKFKDSFKTELIMPVTEFEKVYGKLD